MRVIKDRSLTGSERHVYEALSLFANKQGLAWPKRKTLSEITGKPDSTIGKATAVLVERGHILKVGNGGRGRPAKYLLIQDENPADGERVFHDKPAHSPVGFTGSRNSQNPRQNERGKEQTNKGQGQGRLEQEKHGKELAPPLRLIQGGGA